MTAFQIQHVGELPYRAEKYRWSGWLPSFMNRNTRAFYYTHRDITEAHFPLSPQAHIKEGDVVGACGIGATNR